MARIALILTLQKKIIKITHFMIKIKFKMCHKSFQVNNLRHLMKTCSVCVIEKFEKDFYRGDVCYKCSYRIKIKTQVKAKPVCKICNSSIPKGNSTYCSPECMYEGKLIHNRTYWLRKCTAPKINFKN